MGLVYYHFITYMRTHKYVPPITVFVIMLLLNYAYVPNPIMYSYSYTSLMLFFLMGWFTITIVHAEDKNQKQITIIHTKNKRQYYYALVTNCVSAGLILSLASVMYPVVFNSFAPGLHLVHIVMGLLAHFSLAVLSIALSLFFTRDMVKSSVSTWWGVIGILVASVALAVAKATVLTMKPISWLLPPLRSTLEIMTVDDKIAFIPFTVFMQFGWVLIYSLILIFIYIALVARK